MKKKPEALETLAIRRAKLAQADKVRYRVYSTPTEFIAVIAESALMAVKVAGIKNPHKIVRDQVTDGIAIQAEKMEKREDSQEKVIINSGTADASNTRLIAEITLPDPDAKKASFKPLSLGDLEQSGLGRSRILSPEMLNEIIEQHSMAAQTAAPQDAESAPVSTAAAPVVETVASAPAVPEPQPAPPAPPEPQVSQEDKVMQLANEILPSVKDLPPEPEVNLSADEVDKLLNE